MTTAYTIIVSFLFGIACAFWQVKKILREERERLLLMGDRISAEMLTRLLRRIEGDL